MKTGIFPRGACLLLPIPNLNLLSCVCITIIIAAVMNCSNINRFVAAGEEEAAEVNDH